MPAIQVTGRTIGFKVPVIGTLTIPTGLSRIDGAIATVQAADGTTINKAVAVSVDFGGSVAAGSVVINTWKDTNVSTDSTLVAATSEVDVVVYAWMNSEGWNQ